MKACSSYHVFLLFSLLSPHLLRPSAATATARDLIQIFTFHVFWGPYLNLSSPPPADGTATFLPVDSIPPARPPELFEGFLPVQPSDSAPTDPIDDGNADSTKQQLPNFLANSTTIQTAANITIAEHPPYLATPEVLPLKINIMNPLKRAHAALRAWKRAIISDPTNFTGNWVGDNVCSYNGIVCAPSLRDPSQHAVAGIDLNGADLAGHLPVELSLLKDVALIHVNSNRFGGKVPLNLSKLVHLTELDLSNNGFVGPFPKEVLKLPKLRYLDLRFNNFEGPLPSELFDKDLDALFLNNNRFNATLPENMGNSKVSVMVLSNNLLEGGIPRSIGKMGPTLNELILSRNQLNGCLPHELRSLGNVTVMDLSSNAFVGTLPKGVVASMEELEHLNLANNELTGAVPGSVCKLKKLTNFTFSYNYFNEVEKKCNPEGASDAIFDGYMNCIEGEKGQKPAEVCTSVLSHLEHCGGKTMQQVTGIPSKVHLQASSPAGNPLQPPLTFSSRPPPTPPRKALIPQSPPLQTSSSAPPNPGFDVLPQVGGFGYASPPPPTIKGY